MHSHTERAINLSSSKLIVGSTFFIVALAFFLPAFPSRAAEKSPASEALVEAVISGIESNEAFLRSGSGEFLLEEHYHPQIDTQFEQPPAREGIKLVKPRQTRKLEILWGFDGEKVRCDRKELPSGKLVPGKKFEEKKEAYDGEVTTEFFVPYQQVMIRKGNTIIDYLPTDFGLRYEKKRLSQVLAGAQVSLVAKGEGPGGPDSLVVRLDFEEEGHWAIFWVDRNKGFYPTRRETYRNGRLSVVVEATELREYAQGVWFPQKATHTIYGLNSAGERIVLVQRILTAKQFKPNVEIEDRFFHLVLPKDTYVYDERIGAGYHLKSEAELSAEELLELSEGEPEIGPSASATLASPPEKSDETSSPQKSAPTPGPAVTGQKSQSKVLLLIGIVTIAAAILTIVVRRRKGASKGHSGG